MKGHLVLHKSRYPIGHVTNNRHQYRGVYNKLEQSGRQQETIKDKQLQSRKYASSRSALERDARTNKDTLETEVC